MKVRFVQSDGKVHFREVPYPIRNKFVIAEIAEDETTGWFEDPEYAEKPIFIFHRTFYRQEMRNLDTGDVWLEYHEGAP